MKAVIMAGGGGTRLWPESRKNSPKQTKPFVENETLLQKTYSRVLKKFKPKDIWITTNEENRELIQSQIKQIPLSQYSLEPEKRDTAAAIGLVNLKLFCEDETSSMININSDAFVKDETEYLKCITTIEAFLNKNPDHLVGIGITPNSPETGYGYIKKGRRLNNDNVCVVNCFVEKPNRLTAEKYLADGNYLWNPTLFCWKTKTMLELFKEHAPSIFKKLMQIKPYMGTDSESIKIKEIYPQIEKTSIDYAIFEKCKKMAVLEANFGWSDVGSWSAVKDIQATKYQDNITRGNIKLIDSVNNLVYGIDDKFIAGIGLQDLIIVDTKDALLICNSKHTQDVKKIVTWLEENNKQELL